MEFKGTQGEFIDAGDGFISTVDLIEKASIAKTFRNAEVTFEQYRANKLLFIKSPKMLEMLQKISICLETFAYNKEDLVKLSGEINELIKEATEI